MKHDSEDPLRAALGSEVWAPGRGAWPAGVGARSSRRATAKLAQLLPEPACLLGAANDRRPPPGERQRAHAVRSRQLALWVPVKPLRHVRETPFRPASSSVPCQFCHPSSRGLLSVSPLGALKFHQVDAGEQASGRSSASRRSGQLFRPVRPAQLGWPASGCLGSRCRWRRRAAEDAGSGSRAPG